GLGNRYPARLIHASTGRVSIARRRPRRGMWGVYGRRWALAEGAKFRKRRSAGPQQRDLRQQRETNRCGTVEQQRAPGGADSHLPERIRSGPPAPRTTQRYSPRPARPVAGGQVSRVRRNARVLAPSAPPVYSPATKSVTPAPA